MCNKLHEDYEPIPKRGIGYRIYRKNKDFSFISCVPYDKNNLGVITWKDNHERNAYGAVGFCFFIDKKEAFRLLKAWSDWIEPEIPEIPYEIRNIWYEQGLGKFKEDQFMNGKVFEIALAKTFGYID